MHVALSARCRTLIKWRRDLYWLLNLQNVVKLVYCYVLKEQNAVALC